MKGTDFGIIQPSLQRNRKKSKERRPKELTLDLQVKNFFEEARENRGPAAGDTAPGRPAHEPSFLVCGLPQQNVVSVSCVQMQPRDFPIFPLKHHNGIFEAESIVAEILERHERGPGNLRIGEGDLVSADTDVYGCGSASTFPGEVSGELIQVTYERAASVGRFP